MPKLLKLTASYLQQSVAPLAAEIDYDPQALLTAVTGLGKLGVLALRVPRQWGGLEVSEETFHGFQELVARYSGALAFLQTQHQSASAMIAQSQNSWLVQEYLPRISNGEILLGIGFSQLRRTGEPLVTAVAEKGGYLLNGIVPWVTGWGLFPEFIVAASLPDGRAIFGVVPFVESYQEAGGAIAFSEPSQLAAMTSTNTVTATLKNWFLPQERLVFIKPAGWIHEQDKKNVLRSTNLVLGCALAGLDIVKAAASTKSLPFITRAFDALNLELSQCRDTIKNAQQQANIAFAERLQLRAWAIDLAARIAHAAVTVSSGAANYKHHPAQRVYREALVFTVSGQTTAVMEATLNRLIRPPQQITYSRVIHLSHKIDPNIPQWPGDPPVEFETVAELDQDGYYLRRFSLGEHSATHINSPNSFYINGVGIDSYPAEKLVIPAIVINIRDKAAENPDYALTVADIKAWEQEHGDIPAGSIVLLYTGWQDKWVDKKAFFNTDESGSMRFPGFGSDAAEFLVNERQIAGVGIDTHGVDSGQDTTFATNSLVLAQPRIVLENLTNLDQLPPRGTTLVVGVLLLQGGSGSPAAVMALVP